MLKLIFKLRFVCFFIGLSSFVGCQLGLERVVPSPLSHNEQVDEILEIVPLKTPREEVVEKLEAAGISGNFGPASNSIYYCDLWTREDGSRWHMDVALLFDQSGELYKTRRSQASIGLGSVSQQSQPLEASVPKNGSGNEPASSQPSVNEQAGSRRGGERSPFTDPEAFNFK
jgi:hypothetical protein